MASVFKPKGSKRYVILYFDENGDRRKKTLATDKTVSERLRERSRTVPFFAGRADRSEGGSVPLA